ncbi:hypothetical protein KLP28_01550 [Nocardioidaceae bacterium]|nr:hypothetical protein KLP28_01550 [Nocardioidaceae bacterium]
MPEHSWGAREDRSPGALIPGERARVVDVHRLMHAHELPPSEHPLDVRAHETERQELRTGYHAVLVEEQRTQR